jgi:hypothetical protein
MIKHMNTTIIVKPAIASVFGSCTARTSQVIGWDVGQKEKRFSPAASFFLQCHDSGAQRGNQRTDRSFCDPCSVVDCRAGRPGRSANLAVRRVGVSIPLTLIVIFSALKRRLRFRPAFIASRRQPSKRTSLREAPSEGAEGYPGITKQDRRFIFQALASLNEYCRLIRNWNHLFRVNQLVNVFLHHSALTASKSGSRRRNVTTAAMLRGVACMMFSYIWKE